MKREDVVSLKVKLTSKLTRHNGLDRKIKEADEAIISKTSALEAFGDMSPDVDLTDTDTAQFWLTTQEAKDQIRSDIAELETRKKNYLKSRDTVKKEMISLIPVKYAWIRVSADYWVGVCSSDWAGGEYYLKIARDDEERKPLTHQAYR